MLTLLSLAFATCPVPCSGVPGTLRLEMAGGALTLAGAATTLGLMIPPAFLSTNQELGATWVGLSVLPLETSGPLLLALAGRRYRAELVARQITPVHTPWRYVGWATSGVGLATAVAGMIQGFDEQQSGPWLQVISLPLFVGSSLAFEEDNLALRQQLGPVAVHPGLSVAPVAWAGPENSGLGLSGSF